MRLKKKTNVDLFALFKMSIVKRNQFPQKILAFPLAICRIEGMVCVASSAGTFGKQVHCRENTHPWL